MEPNNPIVPIIKVIFNPLSEVAVPDGASRASGRVTFDQDEEITFKAVEGTVLYTLEVNTALEVRFPSNPIQWVQQVGTELLPIDPPDRTMVSRSDNRITVTFMAREGVPATTFRFYVIVQAIEEENGRFFGSDPTIVTMHP
jgi:hypothetical protein